MRHLSCMMLALASLSGADELAAQTQSAPRLYLSVFGGLRAGRDVWTLRDQPFLVQTLAGPTPGQYDTLDLQRQLVSGFVIGAAGTYFPSPKIGVEGEIAFLGMELESRCAIRQYQPPPQGDLDPELCASLNGATTSMSAVSFSAGLVARLAPNNATNPYFRVNAGLVTTTRGTIEMIGVYRDGSGNPTAATVVGDSAPKKTAPHVTLAAGVAFSLGPSYQLRLEGRDVLISLDRVSGVADPGSGTLYPPHSGTLSHNLVFVVAFDVVLEKRRGRRY